MRTDDDNASNTHYAVFICPVSDETANVRACGGDGGCARARGHAEKRTAAEERCIIAGEN